MNELTTELIAALAQKQDLDEVFRHHLEIAINQLLQTELAEFLGYELIVLGQFTLINIAILRGFTEFVLLTSRSVYCWRYRQ